MSRAIAVLGLGLLLYACQKQDDRKLSFCISQSMACMSATSLIPSGIAAFRVGVKEKSASLFSRIMAAGTYLRAAGSAGKRMMTANEYR